MKLLGSGLIAALGLLCLFVSCKNPTTPGPPDTDYTVSFQNDDGTKIFPDKKVGKGTTINLREKVREGEEEKYVYQPEKTGYFFDFWYLKGDTKETPCTRITVNGNITLVAKWLKYCIVSLEMGEEGTLGGALAGVSNLSFLPGHFFEPGAYRPFRKGYIFLYWYLKDDPSMAATGSIRIEKDITLVARWSEEAWVVTLELDGGVCDRDYITVPIADDATILLAGIKPAKAGYILEGWYYDAAFTDPVPGDTVTVTGNMTLYVKWVLLSFFEPLLGVWTAGAAGPTYFLYIEDSRLFGFYLSPDVIRFFTWTDSILDGKEYSSAPVLRTLTVGTGEDENTFYQVTQKRMPEGNIPLSSRTWAKGDDIKTQVWSPGPIKIDENGNITQGEGKWVWIYHYEKGIWLYLYEDGSGYIRANNKGFDISYVVSGMSMTLDLLRKNVAENGITLLEGEVLLRIPIVPIIEDGKEVGSKPDGFEEVNLLPF